ncbi:MAG: hypothetical protein HON51_12015 [Gammaproteobacteria bacterium]|nr:hypothetical protein [Gammaproteobacteria bacterium]MBT5825637.1 hypothetical protein [Gammaproteobacteria bacterium]MBT5966919.1 hypothetical protein [Gammaproteobacteria bacterium]MBT6419592.1 hypothetical protein [Gammaproteobacteria bacterium]MBT6576924.1 hypothetical protein [Gammaproteobacteria bacterium]
METLMLFSLNTYAESVVISNFSTQTLNTWQNKSFKDHTQYKIVNLNQQKVERVRLAYIKSYGLIYKKHLI